MPADPIIKLSAFFREQSFRPPPGTHISARPHSRVMTQVVSDKWWVMCTTTATNGTGSEKCELWELGKGKKVRVKSVNGVTQREAIAEFNRLLDIVRQLPKDMNGAELDQAIKTIPKHVSFARKPHV